MEITRTRVSAIIIKDKKILLVRGVSGGFHAEFFFTPGGKIEDGETDIIALKRELREELMTDLVKADFMMEYVAKSWDDNFQKVRCYFVEIKKQIELSGEIGEMKWYGKEDFEKNIIPISPSMAEFLIPKLIEKGFI